MSAHTQGPWTCNQAGTDIYRDCGGEPVATVRGEGFVNAKRLANARLIAAAPDMLENAICARDTMSRAADIMEHVCGRRDDAERLRRGADVCRTLIAKATQP